MSDKQRYLFVLDGSKALRAAVDKVFGERAEVQRCQLHKRRNLRDHLPEGCRADYDRQLRNAYAMTGYDGAKAALEKTFRQPERINPSAARSLEEGLEETLTLHRLGVGTLLRRSLSSTNILESCLSTVRHVARNVKRWQGGDHIARWTAAGLLEAQKKFRKVKGYQELKELVAARGNFKTEEVKVKLEQRWSVSAIRKPRIATPTGLPPCPAGLIFSDAFLPPKKTRRTRSHCQPH